MLSRTVRQHRLLEALETRVTVPDSCEALSNLQWLCLSRKYLSSVPDGLPWGKLTLLLLRGNKLEAVPCSALAGAAELQLIDCGDNARLQVTLLLLTQCVSRLLLLQVLQISCVCPSVTVRCAGFRFASGLLPIKVLNVKRCVDSQHRTNLAKFTCLMCCLL